MKILRLAVIAAVALACAGCSSNAPLATTPAVVQPASGDTLKLKTEAGTPTGKPGPVWTVAAYKPSATQLTLSWSDAATTECGRVDSARVEQSSGSVTIQLIPGKKGLTPCSASASFFQTTITLDKAIGQRQLMEPKQKS